MEVDMTEDFLRRHIAAFVEHDSATTLWPEAKRREFTESLARFLWANHEQSERSEAQITLYRQEHGTEHWEGVRSFDVFLQ